jgi:3-hydroxybutyrate dehydrogenase
MPLRGKTALITGSTSGIGLGLAHALAGAGANVAINGLGKKEDIEKIIREIEVKGVKCRYNAADMTRPKEIEAMIDEAHKKFGSLDILVNNAGIQHVAPVDEFPPEKWDAILAINLSAAFHTTRKAIPLMKKSGWGRIINIASAHALVASPCKSAYVAAKHGIAGFTKSVALEVAQNNITVNAICPGYVKTPLVENQIADTAKARGISEDEVVKNVMLAAQWTKKFIGIEEISGLALFLCSNAAANITGTCQSIDGGWTAS